MYGLVIFSLCLSAVYSQFPRACTTPEALKAKSCCPAWEDGSPCGSLSGRGQCRDWVVFTPLSDRQVPQPYDDRLKWPRNYFDSTCECFGNYSSYNCGECKFGYFGEKCDQTKTIVRKEIRELSRIEQQRFFSYLALAKTTKSEDFVVLSTGNRHYRDTHRFVDATIYDVFSWIQYYSMKPIMIKRSIIDPNNNYTDQGPALPGRQRVGLLFLEKQMQLLTGDEHFGLPYLETNCPMCRAKELFGADDVPVHLSSFVGWMDFCGRIDNPGACPDAEDDFQMERVHRNPGGNPHDSTARRSIRNILEDFVRPSDGETLERDMPNLGGTTSKDLLLLLHRVFRDKIFEVWLRMYNGNSSSYPNNDELGQGPNECSTPSLPCYLNKDLLQVSTKFGYKYSVYQDL
ncbi:tyrosinase-like [Spea bombifrons]|uniref:tyrosinase-like n=1 Tax=Spea bombifrons TaxID=233779 RepID=UPI0023494703|nr:tyrosinase-like [Spea bombifrons]